MSISVLPGHRRPMSATGMGQPGLASIHLERCAVHRATRHPLSDLGAEMQDARSHARKPMRHLLTL